MAAINFLHGGNVYEIKRRYNREVIDFSANINPLGLANGFKKTICEKLDHILHYPDPEAKGIKGAISKYWKIKEENILVGNGSTELIYLVVSHFKPRTCLLPAPTFSEYERAARNAKSEVRFFSLKEKDNFEFDISHISGTDMLFLCSPNNPTGNLIFENGRPSYGFPAKLTLIDESFMDFVPDERKLTLIHRAVKDKRIVVLRTLTKFFALPGLRIGYLVAHKEIIKNLKESQSPWSVNVLAQLAGQTLLADKNYIRRTHELIAREKSFLFTRLAKIKGLKAYPSSANFILVKIENKKLTSPLLAKKLVEKGFLVRDCANFRGLGDSFFRVAVRTREENQKLVRVLNSVVGLWLRKEVSKMKKTNRKKKKNVVASRKKCKASGTGLSHYIMSNK